jgi:uncharacterized protein (TIGR03083 family)
MIDYLTHIDADTRRIVEIATEHELASPVPTCDGWTLADLTWHMGEVQHFWAWMVEQRAPSPADYVEPIRPADDAVIEFLDAAREKLVSILAEADPTEECWSWASDQTVGFTFRRQAHEALIHRVDAEIAIDAPSIVDAALADDGVDEILSVHLGDIPSWASVTPADEGMRLRATDTSSSWIVRFGRMTGKSPDTGKTYDVDTVLIDDTATTTAEISDEAGLLDLWLWGRARDAVPQISGDTGLVDRLRALVPGWTQ